MAKDAATAPSTLELENATKSFFGQHGRTVRAVDGVSLRVPEGQTVTIIGESGSGKSTVARLATGILRCEIGRVLYRGERLSGPKSTALGALRREVGVVFQEPFESLNPRMSVGRIVEDPLLIHHKNLPSDARKRLVFEALDAVALTRRQFNSYPGELSGGQQQRVAVARALVGSPSCIVLDEPTSALDLSVQSQILQLLVDLRRDRALTYMFITHDIDVAAYISDTIAVMYRGRILEIGPASEVLARPRHPYTVALLAAALTIDGSRQSRATERFIPIREVDDAASTDGTAACAYWARCPLRADPRCETERPELRPVGPGHMIATFCPLDAALDEQPPGSAS